MTKQLKHTPVMRCNDTMEIRAMRDGFDGIDGVKFFTNQKTLPDARAHFAMSCVSRWAMVAAEPDGVDDAGRQKLRRMSPDELVVHALETSEKLYDAMLEKGWLLEVPDVDEAKEVLRQAEDSTEASND